VTLVNHSFSRKEQQVKDIQKVHCPFIEAPLEDCYVGNMHSQNIDMAMYYCARNFTQCAIYKWMVDPHNPGRSELPTQPK
jgi:hypothetical protein